VTDYPPRHCDGPRGAEADTDAASGFAPKLAQSLDVTEVAGRAAYLDTLNGSVPLHLAAYLSLSE